MYENNNNNNKIDKEINDLQAISVSDCSHSNAMSVLEDTAVMGGKASN